MKKKLLILLSVFCIIISNFVVYAGSGTASDPWTRSEAMAANNISYSLDGNFYNSAAELNAAKQAKEDGQISAAAGGALGEIKGDISTELGSYKDIMSKIKPNAGKVMGLFGTQFWNILQIVMSIVAVILFIVFAIIMFYNYYMVITPGLYFEGEGEEKKGLRRFISQNTKDSINEGASWGKWLKGETKRIIMFIIIEALLAGGLITLISFIMNLISLAGINSAVGG